MKGTQRCRDGSARALDGAAGTAPEGLLQDVTCSSFGDSPVRVITLFTSRHTSCTLNTFVVLV